MNSRLAAVVLAAAAWAMTAAAAGADADCPRLERVADATWLLAAAEATPTPQNGGRTANTTVLAGATGVAIVDPGPHRQAGEALACAIRRVSPLPVVALIDTQALPEQVLAHGAFAGVPIHATAAAAARMAERCAACIARLERLVGADRLAGTRAVLPDRRHTGEAEIDLGGRVLTLVPLGDDLARLAVVDAAAGLAVAGRLADVDRLPDFSDGTLRDARSALDGLAARLRRDGVDTVVPAFGAPFAAARLGEPLAYLDALAQVAAAEVAAGHLVPPTTLPDSLTRWHAGDRRQPLNLQQAMREAEAAWWAASAGAAPDR